MQKIEVFWRDIPAQILVKSGRVRGKVLLSHRFQAAIDRAAMRAGNNVNFCNRKVELRRGRRQPSKDSGRA